MWLFDHKRESYLFENKTTEAVDDENYRREVLHQASKRNELSEVYRSGYEEEEMTCFDYQAF